MLGPYVLLERCTQIYFYFPQVFDSNGIFVKEFGGYGSAQGEFDCLAGVAVNRIGQYIIADRYNHRIQVCFHFYFILAIYPGSARVVKFQRQTLFAFIILYT